MRKVFTWLLLFSITSCPVLASNVPNSPLVLPEKEIYSNETLPKKMPSLKVKDLERVAGRKLTIKEKISFLILKKKTRNQDAAPRSRGKTALIFGIAGAALLIIGFFAPYAILGSLVASIVAIVLGSSAAKKDPNDRKAHSAKLLGWITLGIIIVLMALALALYSPAFY